MPNEPVPHDPRKLRAADTDREHVAKILHDAMSEGRLTVGELDERLQTVYAAKTLGELEPVTSDLPAPSPLPAQHPQQSAADSRIGGTPTGSTSIAVMSRSDRNGSWVVPQQYNAVAIMGGVDLDLTQARFAAREVTITVFALMGGVDIVVPDDVEVHVGGVGIMGAFDDHTNRKHKKDEPERPLPQGAPTVRITGLALMGGVNVKRPKRKKKDREQLPE